MSRKLLLVYGVLLAVGMAFSARADNRPLMFGVLNQQSPARTAERWNPILKYLTAVTGYEFRLKIGSTVAETNGMMARGEFDLAFTNHNFKPEFDGQYRVIARWGNEVFYGVIAVHSESSLHTLHDLANHRVAFPSRDALVAYAATYAELWRLGVPVTVVFAGNQEGALAQLQAKQVEAASVNSRFLAEYTTKTGGHFRTLFMSEPFADLPVIVHPRLSAQQVDTIRQALLSMHNDPRAAPALEAGHFTGFEPAIDSDYDNARRAYRRVAE